MALSRTNDFSGPYTANGVTVAFPFNLPVVADDDIAVTIDGVVVSSSLYTISRTGESGTVTFTTAPASGEVLVILNPDFEQSTEFTIGAAFYAPAVNGALDKAASRDIYLKGQLDRAVKVPAGETAPSIASLADAEGKVLGVVDGNLAPIPNTSAAVASDVAAAAQSAAAANAANVSAQTAQEDAEAARDAAEGFRDDAEDLVSLATNIGTAQIEKTWAALNAITGAVGDSAIIPEDAGTHTDPVVGGTVDNTGVYKWSASPAGWERIADTDAVKAKNEADRAEDARDEAELFAFDAKTAIREGSRQRWERLLAAFAGGLIPRGKINLEDYGITGWTNVYNVLLYWTGSVLYPLAKIDSNFNFGWADSDILHTEPNGDMYHSVDIVKMQDPTLKNGVSVTTYHARYLAIGDDPQGVDDTSAGRGASSANPYRSLNFALTQAKAGPQPFHIYAYGDVFGINSLSSSASMTISDGVTGKITFVPTRLNRSWMVPMREGMTKAMWAWTNPVPRVYRSASTTSPINDAMKKTFAMADALNVNDNGLPIPLTYLGGTWANEAAAQAAVAAQPGSFAWYGTTGASLVLFVHLIDGREPDPVDWWLVETSQNTTWTIGELSKLYIENLGRFGFDQGTRISAIRARPISVTDTSTRVVHTGEFWLYNCAAMGASGCAVQIFDIARGGMSQFDASHCLQDAENIHSFYATTAGAGDYMHWFTSFLRAVNIGYNPYGNQPSVGDSNQVVSGHDQARVTRWNIVGGNTRGPVLYDVLGCQSLNINVHVSDPRQTHEANYTPQAAFACDGALGGPAGAPLSKIRLLHCSGKVPYDKTPFWVRGGGVIDYAHQIGRTSSTVHASGGSINNVLPA